GHTLFFRTVLSANTLVRWVNENAFAPILRARPGPTFGRPVHLRDGSLGYGPVLPLMPFGSPLTVDTLPSGDSEPSPASEAVNPAFGYDAPHPSIRGTSTLLNIASLPLLSVRVDFRIKLFGACSTFTARCSPRARQVTK